MMKDYFVHYHTFPRYDKDVSLFNMNWIDTDWPNFKGGTEISEEKLNEIKDYMAE